MYMVTKETIVFALNIRYVIWHTGLVSVGLFYSKLPPFRPNS